MNDMKPIIHIVKPGDTLYNLATQYGATVQKIMENNMALDIYNLRVGQRILIYPGGNQGNRECISPKQVELLKQMNLVWEQHIMWTRMLLISIASDLKDLAATQTRLLQNPKDIANIFRKYYGNNAANRIQNLLTEHLAIGKDLIVALKNNNQEEARKLNDKWYRNADEMAEAFSSINPFYKKNEIRNMLYEHLRFTTSEVNNRLKGNFAEDISDYDKVQREILKMSEYFVDGIVKQFPNMF